MPGIRCRVLRPLQPSDAMIRIFALPLKNVKHMVNKLPSGSKWQHGLPQQAQDLLDLERFSQQRKVA